MTIMQAIPGPARIAPCADAVCLQVAVSTLRAMYAPTDSPGGGTGLLLPPCAYLVQARRAFRAFRLAACSHPGARAVRLAPCCAPALTKDECRLLRALAAAQAGDAPLLDNYLYKFALDRCCRACLAEGVCCLAAALCHAGFAVPVLNGAVVVVLAAGRKQAVLF